MCGICLALFCATLTPLSVNIKFNRDSIFPIHSFCMFCHFLLLNFPLVFLSQVQPKPGVISSVGGVTLGKGGMQIQMLGASLTQMPAPQPPASIQAQVNERCYMFVLPLVFKF